MRKGMNINWNRLIGRAALFLLGSFVFAIMILSWLAPVDH